MINKLYFTSLDENIQKKAFQSIEEEQKDWVIWTNGLCSNSNTTLSLIAMPSKWL